MITPYARLDGKHSQVHFDELTWIHEDKSTGRFEKWRSDGKKADLLGFYLPPFQRPEVWTVKQKRSFIESVFVGNSIGSVVFVSTDIDATTDGWLIDGQQRLTAVRDFLSNSFTIFNDISWDDVKADIPYANNWYDYQHKDDEGNVSIVSVTPLRHWRRSCFDAVIIDETNEEYLKVLYERMNYGGTAHTEEDRKRIHGRKA